VYTSGIVLKAETPSGAKRIQPLPSSRIVNTSFLSHFITTFIRRRATLSFEFSTPDYIIIKMKFTAVIAAVLSMAAFAIAAPIAEGRSSKKSSSNDAC